MMVQLFYARRIWILIRNRWLVALIIVTSCISGRACLTLPLSAPSLMLPISAVCGLGSAVVVGIRPKFTELASYRVSNEAH